MEYMNDIHLKTEFYISLGSTCATANYLNSKGYRQSSYPFDWCNVNIKQLNQTLSTDFYNYTEFEHIKYSETYPYYDGKDLIDKGSSVLKNKIGIKFAHELLEKYDIEEYKGKLTSRIEKFKQLKSPTFIRYEEGKQKSYYNDELLSLLVNLTMYFTDFELTLLVPASFNITINNSCLKIIKYDCEYSNWKNEKAFELLMCLCD